MKQHQALRECGREQTKPDATSRRQPTNKARRCRVQGRRQQRRSGSIAEVRVSVSLLSGPGACEWEMRPSRAIAQDRAARATAARRRAPPSWGGCRRAAPGHRWGHVVFAPGGKPRLTERTIRSGASGIGGENHEVVQENSRCDGSEIERGIYRVCERQVRCLPHTRRRPRFRTVGNDLELARAQRLSFMRAARFGVVAAALRLRLETVAGWWLERYQRRVATGERRPRMIAVRSRAESGRVVELAAAGRVINRGLIHICAPRIFMVEVDRQASVSG